MSPEQALWEEKSGELSKIAENYIEFVKEFHNQIKASVKRASDILINMFIQCCLNDERLNKRARIYLNTKNRRIKRKQFKLLIREVMG